ncbi:MAG: hypothetical protein ACYC2R_16355 [Burkholderiales bacterium]
MRFTPSLPPLTGISETGEVKPLRDIRAVQPVRERLNAPFIKLAAQRGRASAEDIQGVEEIPPAERRVKADRREVCRRLYHSAALMDTRALVERRRGKRRRRDATTTIDEDA